MFHGGIFITYFFINFYIYRDEFHLLIVGLLHAVLSSFVMITIRWGPLKKENIG